jgi:hypothetical protein
MSSALRLRVDPLAAESIGLEEGGRWPLARPAGRRLDRRRPRWPARSGDGRRFYFDHGDETLDAFYAASSRSAIDETFRARRLWPEPVRDLVFPGAQHNERPGTPASTFPLKFLLPPASVRGGHLVSTRP